MEQIGWDVIPVAGEYLFSRRIGPIALAKFQRPQQIHWETVEQMQHKLAIWQLTIEPALSFSFSPKLDWRGWHESNAHYTYTKTAVVDTSGSEQNILGSFSETLRYQMRRSERAGLTYRVIPFGELTAGQKDDILALHQDWHQEKKVMGYPDAFLQSIWKEMVKEGAMVLGYKGRELHAALFWLHHHHVGMYFYQFTSREGRGRFYAPSGLALGAIRLNLAHACDVLDLCSVYDTRYGAENLKWQGFSEHKSRFHPTYIEYPKALSRTLIHR
jgi:hypothetical protein